MIFHSSDECTTCLNIPIYPMNYLTTTSRPYWLLHNFSFHLVHPEFFLAQKSPIIEWNSCLKHGKNAQWSGENTFLTRSRRISWVKLNKKLKLESKSIFRSFDYLGENFSRISLVCHRRTIGAGEMENVHPR